MASGKNILSLFLKFYYFFCPHCVACGSLALHSRMQPVPPCIGSRVSTTRPPGKPPVIFTSYQSYYQLVISERKSSLDFDNNCVIFLDKHGEYCHLKNIKSLKVCTWNIFPFILAFFNFISNT